jgi:hypothetical protein
MSTEVPGRDIDNKHQPNRDGNNAGLPYASESASALFTQHDTSPPSSLLQLRAQSHTGTVSQTVSPHDTVLRVGGGRGTRRRKSFFCIHCGSLPPDSDHEGKPFVRERLGSETRSGAVLELRSGFDPPGLDRPGRLPHQQGLCEARLARGLPRRVTPIGGRGPGTRGLELERAGRHCMQSPGKQRESSAAACKGLRSVDKAKE